MRIKVGVGAKPRGMDLADYVLGRFSSGEQAMMEEAYRDAGDAVELLLSEGMEKAMNRYNMKKKEA